MTDHSRSQAKRSPRDAEEAAAFKEMGQTIRRLRESRDIPRNRLASICEMTEVELEQLERGERDEGWGGMRLIARAFAIPLADLLAAAQGPRQVQASWGAEAGGIPNWRASSPARRADGTRVGSRLRGAVVAESSIWRVASTTPHPGSADDELRASTIMEIRALFALCSWSFLLSWLARSWRTRHFTKVKALAAAGDQMKPPRPEESREDAPDAGF